MGKAVENKAIEGVAKALFDPEIIKLHPDMRWENLPEDVRVSYLATAERVKEAILSDPSTNIIEVDRDAELPFKRTFIGEERSMPNHTEIWFLTKEEYEEAKTNWMKPVGRKK